MRLVMIVALLVVLIIAVLLLIRPSGPRVTRIEHRTEREDEEERDS